MKRNSSNQLMLMNGLAIVWIGLWMALANDRRFEAPPAPGAAEDPIAWGEEGTRSLSEAGSEFAGAWGKAAGGVGVSPLSPSALAISPDGRRVYVACASADMVMVVDALNGTILHRWVTEPSPSGLALSRDGRRLYVTCGGATSTVLGLDTESWQVAQRLRAGHTAMAPVLSPDGRSLYVCNRHHHDLSEFDLATGRERGRIRVGREPVAAALTPDGLYLLVANHLHSGTADHLHASAAISVVHTGERRVTRTIRLVEGAGLLRDIAISPDGRFAAGTLVQGRYWLTPTEVDMGRINCNGLYVLDVGNLSRLGVLLLDQAGRGAANPWGVGWTGDSRTIVVSHAGTHELSLVDAPRTTNRSEFLSQRLGVYMEEGAATVTRMPEHRVRVRERVRLPANGPRAVVVQGTRVIAANWFSDDLVCLEVAAPQRVAVRWPLRATGALSEVRRGEMYFNDARLCRQGWQSCASCHDVDGRMDAFNWDLLNDGVGNPKNTKSLLLSPDTAPVMALGVRANAGVAVRAGLHHILFNDPPPEVASAIEAYLQSLQPAPSPWLENGELSAAARRGRILFHDPRTGCATCHPPSSYTDLCCHDVGTSAAFEGLWSGPAADRPDDRFDTPTLIELWRTAPYLHHGNAATLRDVLTIRNPQDRHGRTSHLSSEQVEELVAFLLSI